MIKRILVVMMVLLMAASVAAVCQTPQQNVNIDAYYLLKRLDSKGPATITFSMTDYAAGYAYCMKAIKLQVGAPGGWTLNATAIGGGSGTINALAANADGGYAGWRSLGSGSNTLRPGSNGECNFWIHYRVDLSKLSAANMSGIHATVTVTYSLI
jgi:hypothetical protein